MSNTVIKVENISKQYRLGLVGTGTIAHDFKRWINRLRGKEDPYLKLGDENDRNKGNSDYVWSLKDINFEIGKGEVVGIIGKNGAGKSTLLKILSQVTSPTLGTIKIKGRIASLLEVGTGFHPELTGRENIFLNGAILGMTKREIINKFDEIVEFSGIGRYIDTPVKRYSSGMYVRLAFSVAAHLEPEILIIDEVLAVGDAEFQKKCLGKMKDVAAEGRTVLFVSHNMNAVSRLCKRAILLKNGKLINSGPVDEIVNQYLSMDKEDYITKVNFINQENKDIALLSAELLDFSGNQAEKVVDVDKHFTVRYTLKFNTLVKSPHLTFHLQNSRDEFVLFSDRKDDTEAFLPQETGEYLVQIKFPLPFLKPDRYSLSVGLVNSDTGQTNHFPSLLNFEIQDLKNARVERAGYFFIPFKWEINKIN